ncbi:MAG: glycosyltransferase family 39 protein [Candidatus Hydrogenedentes bacterium]|nr:glycosyltransferase family 39 protein [Candidatus Hydrogenedentota bacterium]
MNPGSDTSRARYDLVIACTAALSLRLVYLFLIGRVIDMPDAIHYIDMARLFASGEAHAFDENLPVLYPALGAAMHLFVGDWEHAFWMASLLFSTLLVIPVYLLTRELFGQWSARIAVLTVCLWPWLMDYGSRIAPESVAIFFWFLGIVLLHRGIERGGAWPVAAAVSLFALHLTRPEGTFILLAAPVGGLILSLGRERIHIRRLATFTVTVLLLLAAYSAVMYALVGTATVSYRAPMTSDLFDYFRRGGTEFVRTFMRLFYNEMPVMLGPVLLLFLGVGVFRSSERPRALRLEFLILFFCGVQFGLTLANFSPAPRYIMPIVVALSLWSARGIELVTRQIVASNAPRWLRFAPIGAMVAAMLLGALSDVAGQYLGAMPRMPREYKIAGQWMKENLEPGYVISRKPQVGYYANMPTTGPAADAHPKDIVEMARNLGARYVVIDERYTASIVPGLRPLLDPQKAPAAFKLHRADLSPYPGARIVIYEIVAPGIRYLTPEEFPSATSHMGPDEPRRKPAPQLEP